CGRSTGRSMTRSGPSCWATRRQRLQQQRQRQQRPGHTAHSNGETGPGAEVQAGPWAHTSWIPVGRRPPACVQCTVLQAGACMLSAAHMLQAQHISAGGCVVAPGSVLFVPLHSSCKCCGIYLGGMHPAGCQRCACCAPLVCTGSGTLHPVQWR
ncbi:hypothetical protein COO60DRAFT_1559357, partial [Scenedesmus sp. NREL 46B-D3]